MNCTAVSALHLKTLWSGGGGVFIYLWEVNGSTVVEVEFSEPRLHDLLVAVQTASLALRKESRLEFLLDMKVRPSQLR